jgi:hypothetical protein
MAKSEKVTPCMEIGYGPIAGAVSDAPTWHYQMQPGAAYLCVGSEGWDGPFPISKEVAKEATDSYKLGWINGKTVAIFEHEDGKGTRRYAQPIPMHPGAVNEVKGKERHKVEKEIDVSFKDEVASHGKEPGVVCKGCGSSASIHMSSCPIKYPTKKGAKDVGKIAQQAGEVGGEASAARPRSGGRGKDPKPGPVVLPPAGDPPVAREARGRGRGKPEVTDPPAPPPAPVAPTPSDPSKASKLAKFLAKHNL